jgi:uncharacterized protein
MRKSMHECPDKPPAKAINEMLTDMKKNPLDMRRSHAHLLRLYHDPKYVFCNVSIDYINRGAKNDISTVFGKEIRSLLSGWMEIESAAGTTCIPYHRILRILYEGQIIWERSLD